MPTDLSFEERDLIRVRDRAGIGLPFSRGLMATSILATGLGTSDAYRIAERIQQDLLESGRRELDTGELARLAEAAIARSAGAQVAARYRAWRDVHHGGRPIVICLGGAPGVGKSTMATRLALRLGVNRVVPTDAIREVLRTVIPDTVLPELHLSTYESIHDDDGSGSTATFLRQSRAVGAATAAVAGRMAAEGRNVILEGIHLLPGDLRARLAETRPAAIVVELLLTLPDEALHRGQLLRRARTEPGRDGRRHLEHFAVIRTLQEELRRMAAHSSVPEYDIGHPETLTQRIVDRVVEEVEARTCAA